LVQIDYDYEGDDEDDFDPATVRDRPPPSAAF